MNSRSNFYLITFSKLSDGAVFGIRQPKSLVREIANFHLGGRLMLHTLPARVNNVKKEAFLPADY